VAGNNVFSAGQGQAQGSAWNPTILYLFVFILAEMVIFGMIAKRV
jgi:hypothetical protein